jgi:hypothetical protein
MNIPQWNDVYPTEYDDGDREYPPSWRDFEEMQKSLSTIEDFLKGVLDEVFGEQELNPDRLSWYLDEIAHQVDVKIPNKQIRLKRLEALAHSANLGE